MKINEELDELKEVIDLELKKALYMEPSYEEKIYEAIDYSLFTGGKRLRPIMNLKSCQIFAATFKDSIPYAIAIEMIHTYSLIHDDLPAMDDDHFRRGKPTSHKVFGEAMAILAGDGLLNLAFETVLSHMENEEDNIRLKSHVRALNEISKYSGTSGMIGGQVVDLLADKGHMTGDELVFMYKAKTAALIQAALVSGAIIGGASDEDVEIIRDFGYNLGMAYQIRDDILDFEEDASIDKLTYLTFYNLDKAEEKVEEYSRAAIEILDKLKDKDTSFFKDLTRELVSRNK